MLSACASRDHLHDCRDGEKSARQTASGRNSIVAVMEIVITMAAAAVVLVVITTIVMLIVIAE